MPYIIDENADNVSSAIVFEHVRRCLTSMLDDSPAGTSEARLLETAIKQITARLALAQAPELAAQHLGGARRLLKNGGLRM